MRLHRVFLVTLLLAAGLWLVIRPMTDSGSDGRTTAQLEENPPPNGFDSAASVTNALLSVTKDAFQAFGEWTERFLAARPEDRASLPAEGVPLAAVRRVRMSALIESDPQEALRRAVPMRIRRELPGEVLAQLEERVSGRGDLDVLGVLPVERTQAVPAIERFARLNGRVFRAFVYGRRSRQRSRVDIPLHGIAIDGRLALHENPVRPHEPGELAQTAGDPAEDPVCGVSGLPSGRVAAADVGSETVYFCTAAHLEAYADMIIQGEEALALDEWTSGIRTLLFMRVIFPDDTEASLSDLASTNLMNSTSNWFAETSYNITGLKATITPLLTLPNPKGWYASNNNYGAVLNHARSVALSNGFDTADYDLDCVHLKFIFSGWSGRAFVGAKGAWLQSGGSVGVAVHEFGHNYGLWHANFWNASGDTVIGPGMHEEYGNIFDTMGSASAGDLQFNAYEKNILLWMPDTNVAVITNSGLYRLYAFDVPALSNDFTHALKINKDSRDYWVELRRKFTSNRWVQNGVLLNWSPWTGSAGGTHLLDTTPGSPNGKSDSALVLGRTFTDPFAGIHITPIRRNTNTSPVSMDVVVNLGLFPENSPPGVLISADATAVSPGTMVNFTASASDPDGDALAFFWDFGDQTFGTNGLSARKSWAAAGDYVVRCVVTDMKGGTASAAVLVTVGSPTTFRISGRILEGVSPVPDVRVTAGAFVSYTDSNGDYTLTGLPAGNYTNNAVKAGWILAPSGFANPVAVGPNASNVNFSAMPATYQISGRVTDNSIGVAGVLVTLGSNSVVTPGSGSFAFTGLAPGFYSVSAAKANYELRCAFGWTNPIALEWASATNKDFERELFYISGVVSNAPATPMVSIGDTVHVANVFSSGGEWQYYLLVPRGRWNLVATLPGYTILPANFANPVTVLSNIFGGSQGEPGGGLGGMSFDFDAAPGATYVLSGNVNDFGHALADAVVSAGAHSGFTDTMGDYDLPGLSNGAYVVTASLADYTFTPGVRNVTINNAHLGGQDFLARLSFALADARMTNGGFRFRISGGSNRVFSIENSSNLSAWSGVAVVTNLGGQEIFPESAEQGARFYRGKVLP